MPGTFFQDIIGRGRDWARTLRPRPEDPAPRLLPDGRWVPHEAWRARHRWVVALLWLHVPALFLFAVYVSEAPFLGASFETFEPLHVAGEVGIVALLALVASLASLSRRVRGIAAAMGLTTSSALLVHFSGGLIEAHFHFIAILVIVSLYQDWLPLGLCILYVAVHHAIAGTIDPTSVYNHPAALAHPIRWAFVHAFFVLGVATATVVHWRTAGMVRSHVDQVVAASSEGIVGVDATGRVSVINAAAERLLGPREQLLGQPFATVVGNRLPGLVASDGSIAPQAGGPPRRGHGARFTRDEGVVFIDWSSTPIGAPGDPVGAVVTLRDVTERHLAESWLRERERKLSAAQRIAHVGSVEWAPVSGVLRISEETRSILEGAHGRTIGEIECLDDFLGLLHREDRGFVAEAFERAHREGAAVELDCRIGEGPMLRHCDLRVQLDELTDQGEPVRLVHASLHDVTDRINAEQMRRRALEQEREIQLLIEQDSFKNKFINAVAHELNTPLTPLRLQLHLLKMDTEGTLTERQRRAVHMLDRNVQRFGSLVNDLLDAARLQGGRLKMKPVLLDLSTVAEEAIEHFEGVMLEKDLVLETDIQPETHVLCDRDRMMQVVYNLLSNACKFTPRGGTIEVGVRRLEGEILLKVRDTGIGISAADQGRLFQAFTQVQDHMERTESGTGLGLYLCKGLVELHNGRIWCESEGAGKGATFIVALPQSAAVTGLMPRSQGTGPSLGERWANARVKIPGDLKPQR